MPRGNPNIKPGPGRPKGSKNSLPLGFARLVQERTNDGARLVDEAFKILDEGKIAEKIEIIKWLADRGFGPAKVSIEHSGSIGSGEGTQRLRSAIARLSPEDQKREGTGKPH